MAAYDVLDDQQRKDVRIAIVRLLKTYGLGNEENGDMNNALHSLLLTLLSA